ncbi:cell division protein FtsX [Alsobacter metallidurans]|uniref:Cell division protein FtsX n=2 Tax=Alsobacter metallidurans TaxID=340221 RepID=A0A917IDI2_9HYPH|nr:cell division protein FtsX [Alsobacter metallidurans]
MTDVDMKDPSPHAPPGLEWEPEAAGEKRERPLGRNQPLVPAASIAGRALVTVIAIMTFLAGLTAGAAQLLSDASADWRSQVSREVTIQVRPGPGRAIEDEVAKAAAAARAAPGVAEVRIYSKQESERLLEPWLGVGLNFDELPVPRLVVLKIAPDARVDFATLRQTLANDVKGASLDDHRVWMERLATMANTFVLLGLGILALVLSATGLAVAFATRGAMDGNRGIVEVLHFVGASDSYIAVEFQRHFLRLGLRGGLIGGAAALGFYLAAGWTAAAWTATPEGTQLEALFGRFALGWRGFLAVVAIALLVAVVTAVVSRLTVRRTLQELS